MAANSTQRGPVAIYGATGYTGRLVAAELARRGADFVLCGRNAGKLEQLSASLGGAPISAAALDDPAALRAALEPCAAVISCAGPFVIHGEPVVKAAIEAGTSYVDTTGEQPFMRGVFELHGPRATTAGVALVTAMGFDYFPGDMIASLTSAGLGPVDDLLLAYSVRAFGASRGTASSAVGQLSGGDVEWRNGALAPGSQKVRRPSFEFPAPIGRQAMTRYPAGEQITVPRHVEVDTVRTVLTASTSAPHPRLAATVPVAIGVIGRLLRTRARGPIERAVARMPDGPEVADRRRSRFTIVCEARGGGRRRRGVIEGSDVYGITAVATVEAALRLAEPGYDRVGALAPSQAFEPADFLAAMAPAGVQYEVFEP